jgi:hypothetical protein
MREWRGGIHAWLEELHACLEKESPKIYARSHNEGFPLLHPAALSVCATHVSISDDLGRIIPQKRRLSVPSPLPSRPESSAELIFKHFIVTTTLKTKKMILCVSCEVGLVL